MSKFHINKHGVPAPCRAKTGNCPLGGSEQHFDTIEGAQAYADNQSEQQHGLLPGIKSKINLLKEKISGESYDKGLLSKNSKIENADLTMKSIGSAEKEGFISLEEAVKEEELYNKDLVQEQEVPEVNLSSEKLGMAKDEGFISTEDANDFSSGKAYNKELAENAKVPEVDLTMEDLGDAQDEQFVSI